MVEVIQGTDNSLTLAVLVGAWGISNIQKPLIPAVNTNIYVLSTIGSDLPGDVI